MLVCSKEAVSSGRKEGLQSTMYLLIAGNGLAEEAGEVSCGGKWEADWSSKPKAEDSVSCETEERLHRT